MPFSAGRKPAAVPQFENGPAHASVLLYRKDKAKCHFSNPKKTMQSSWLAAQ
jgi:hypothetical protein